MPAGTKPALIIIGAGILAVLAGVILFAFLDRACSITAPLQAQQQQNGTTEHRPETGDDGQDRAETDYYATPETLIPFQRNRAVLEESEGTNQTERAKGKPRDWGHDFLCDVKATDAAIAMFTLFLVIVGAWQGFYIRRSVNVAERALTDLERPYVFYRPPKKGEIRAAELMRREVLSGADCVFVNRGRTPAILTEWLCCPVVIEKTSELPLPIDAEMERGEKLAEGIVIAPNKGYGFSVNIEQIVGPQETWKAEQGVIGLFLVGYLRYRDIFGARYILGFCARFEKNGLRQTFSLQGGESHNYSKTESA